jgi:sulfate adenylyltransferase
MIEPYGGFILVHIATTVEVCEQRDRKGLYARARAGQLRGMTGIDDPYEEPADAELVIDTSTMPVSAAIEVTLGYLVENGWVEPKLA